MPIGSVSEVSRSVSTRAAGGEEEGGEGAGGRRGRSGSGEEAGIGAAAGLGDAVDAIRDPSEARDKGGEYNGGAVDRRDDRHRHKHECECRNAQLAASVHYESYPPALAPRVLAAGPQREALLDISRVLHDEQRKRGDQSRQSSETHAKTLPRCCGELNPVVRLTVI